MPLPRAHVNLNRSQISRIGRTSDVTLRNGFYAGVVVAVIWGIYLFRLWQPGATWPWDWKLVTVPNAALDISDYSL
jgi:hypothetical protein